MRTMKAVEQILTKLRALCLALPEVSEVPSWGHPNFKAGKKTFAVLEEYKGEWAVAFNAGLPHQEALVASSERFYVTPYSGKHGWVSMRVAGGVDWKELAPLVMK